MDGRMNKHGSRAAAIILVAACYVIAKLPALTKPDTTPLAAHFSFEKLALPEVAGHPPHKFVRQVHPSLERISAWVSSLGAAVSVADLDGDGLPNDVIHVDPRTDLVTVLPAPGTGERYPPFALDRSFWSRSIYDPATIAPMGSVVGDFNEDGLPDVLVYFWGRTPVLYLRKAGATPDDRVAEAIELVESKRDSDGRWPLENQHPGTMPVDMDEGEGRPSRWNTLRALRVLDWYSARD